MNVVKEPVVEIECLGCGGGLRQASRTVQVCVGAVFLALSLIAIFSDSGTHATVTPAPAGQQPEGSR